MFLWIEEKWTSERTYKSVWEILTGICSGGWGRAERDEAVQGAQHAKRGTDIWYSRYKAVAADLALSQRKLAVSVARSSTLALLLARGNKDKDASVPSSLLSRSTSSMAAKGRPREVQGRAAGFEQDPLSFGVSFGGLGGGGGEGGDEEEELRERLCVAEQELTAVSDEFARVKAEYEAQGPVCSACA